MNLASVERAAATIAPLAAQIEADRRLPPEAIAALQEAGVFKLLVPRALGGSEAPIVTFLTVLETIAAADGSAGWCAMIGASSGLMSRLLDESVARQVYEPADAITCGVFAPMGRAVRVDGGYRVSGRWPFASGSEHSQWRMGGVLVEGETLPNGAPHVRCVLFRADETRIHDTWDVSGLRGTGSHDMEVVDVVVPQERCFSFFEGKQPQIPFFGVLAAGVSAVAVGIARAAVDSIVALAKAKHPLGSKRGIAHRELVQLSVAQAEAKVRSARAFLHEAAEAAERDPSLRNRASLRLAAAHATRESAAAVDLAYEAGGATSIYAKHPLQRHYRDVHVATQHVMVSSTATTLAGRILLDLESDTSTL